MSIQAGDRMPEGSFATMTADGPGSLSTEELFAGKKVVLFSVPGAFTPTCSSTHLPRYEALYDCFKEAGVDDIVCMSVNDAFVMDEWGKSQQADRVRLIPDGSGAFARGMGMLVNKDEIGFGDRSWRYSMLVRDGIVEKMFIEPDNPGDPFEVSDADTMLAYVAPSASAPADVTVLSREGCPFCVRAKGLLRDAGIDFEELVLNRDYTDTTLRAVAGANTFPQIFINGAKIGGSEDLEKYLAKAQAA